MSGTYPAQQTLSCAVGSLASGASFTATVSSSTSYEKCTVYDNEAKAEADNFTPTADQGSISCRKPSLTVNKVPDDQIVSAGDPLTFTIVVSNAGPGTAKGVAISDPLPKTTASAWVTSTAGCGVGAADANGVQTLTCAVGDLPAQGTFSVSVSSTTSHAKCTVYDNSATATATNHPSAADDGKITCRVPNLQVDKVADEAQVDAGDPISFTVTVRCADDPSNAGDGGTAKAVVLTDQLPTKNGLTWSISGVAAGCTIDAGTQLLKCEFGDMAAATSASVRVVSSATAYDACGSYPNVASSVGDNFPGPATGSATAQVVHCGCTLTQGYWKTHGPAPTGNNSNMWPEPIKTQGLTLGMKSYTPAEMQSIFGTSVNGNGLIALAHQLMAAKLNIANDASPKPIASAIADADRLIKDHVVPPVGNGFLGTSVTSALVQQLDDFNNGRSGPRHCDSLEPTVSPAP